MDKQEYFDDLNNIITDKIYIGNSVSELNEEIRNNEWHISMSQELCEITKKEDFLDFFETVIDNRKKQISDSNKNHGMIFYLWFDEQACQLRFNIISDFYETLPFGCELKIIDKPNEIIDEFLNNNYHNGLPLQDFIEVTKENDNKVEIEKTEYVLKVYRLDVKKIKNDETART